MATLRRLASESPNAADEWFVLVDASLDVSVGAILIANHDASGKSFRLAVLDAGEADITTKDYIAYDENVSGNSRVTIEYNNLLRLPFGVRLFARCSTTTASFQVWGTP